LLSVVETAAARLLEIRVEEWRRGELCRESASAAPKMNLYKRGMIFVTFLGCCLALGLLVGALGTPFWVVSSAVRIPNPDNSDGAINFGIFTGRKSLNVGYGARTTEFQGYNYFVNIISSLFLRAHLFLFLFFCVINTFIFMLGEIIIRKRTIENALLVWAALSRFLFHKSIFGAQPSVTLSSLHGSTGLLYKNKRSSRLRLVAIQF